MTEAAVAAPAAPPLLVPISDKEFGLFQRFMLSEAGVTMAPSKKALVRGRLAKRLKARGCRSFTEYHNVVRNDREERQCAVDLLTTNETYFFREPKHFAFLRETVLPAHTRGRPFRAWSAACSSGEEVYSIAMVLAETLADDDWSVLGSDLNSQVLSKARSGHYSLARTEGIPRRSLEQHCLKGTGSQTGSFLVGRELRARTEFRQINLNATPPRLQPFDVIFLRNVMIYFSQETKRQVVRRILTLLRPGGYFFIGHSESLNGISSQLELIRPSIFRKPL